MKASDPVRYKARSDPSDRYGDLLISVGLFVGICPTTQRNWQNQGLIDQREIVKAKFRGILKTKQKNIVK